VIRAAASKRIGLVDEQNPVERTPDRAIGLDRRHPDVLSDEPRAVDLDQVTLPEQPDRAVGLGEQARNRRLPRPGIAQEGEVLRGRDLRQPVLQPLRLNLKERDQRAYLLLDRLEPDEGVQLHPELLQAPGRYRRLARVEPVEPVHLAADRSLDLLAQDAHAAKEVVERACHACSLP
jgi:hypothetical protein